MGRTDPIGLGRLLHRDILDDVGWKLWEDRSNFSLDFQAWQKLQQQSPVFRSSRMYIDHARDLGCMLVDVKSDTNIWRFSRLEIKCTNCSTYITRSSEALLLQFGKPLVDRLSSITKQIPSNLLQQLKRRRSKNGIKADILIGLNNKL
jgi:hypothetical protein